MTEVNQATQATNTGNTSDPTIEQINQNTESYQQVLENSEESGSNSMSYYLKLQRAMMQEQQAYTAVSTILKARSDASLTAIRNFK